VGFRVDENGSVRWDWRRAAVPLIGPEFLTSVVFLYETVADAEDDQGYGGSGFLIGVAVSGSPLLVHLYAVTNEHVASACQAVKFTYRPHGYKQIIGPDERGPWWPHEDGDDVAVAHLGIYRRSALQDWVPFPSKMFVNRSQLTPYAIVPGEDCFMCGRFIRPRESESLDKPVMRFGNLASWPQTITQYDRGGFQQESFLVDMRSISGYSGSPVYAYYTLSGPRWPVTGLNDPMAKQADWSAKISDMWLLGIDWGNLQVPVEMSDTDGNVIDDKLLVNSGVSAVVPAWKIAELLMQRDDVLKERTQIDDEQYELEDVGSELDGATFTSDASD
jgi:hypothetical protein